MPNDVLLVRLKGGLWHDAVDDIDQFLQKISFYSELCRGAQPKLRSVPHILLGGWWAFFRSYVVRLGFLEGWRGLLIAHCEAQGSYFKHMKLAFLERSKKALHGFTHTGKHAITRRFGTGEIGSYYSERDVLLGVQLAQAVGLFAVLEMATYAGAEDLGRAAMSVAKRVAPNPGT